VVSQKFGKMPMQLSGGFDLYLYDLAIIHLLFTPNTILSFQTTELTRSHL